MDRQPSAPAPFFDRHDFRQVVRQAFPERADLARLRTEGSPAQVWEACARFLGLDTAALAARLAPVYGVPLAGPLNDVSAEALALTPARFCQAHAVLPLRLEDGALVMATADPADENVSERARFLVGRPIRWALAPPQDIDDAASLAIALEAQRQSHDGEAVPALDENAIVRLARTLMAQAIDARASDLHIQPFLGAFAVRIRVDGQLRRLTMLPDLVATSVIRHVKARSGMDPTNQQLPQDGRMNLVHDDREFDLRVSSLPASRGERLVLRFLDQSRVHSLSTAGFSLAALQLLRRATRRPSGMVILTGPTGCGKTSTLYGMLAELNRSHTNIITVENPVEYRIAGISQVEVNDKAGRSFASTLRTILRQDPDVVLVGEIRDEETAKIAVQAALTGHLVFSTVHTNDSVSSITRLKDFGVQPFAINNALLCAMAQRLVRRICDSCARPETPSERTRSTLALSADQLSKLRHGGGCDKCRNSGYRGRLGVYEMLRVTPKIQRLIETSAPAADIQAAATTEGFRPLWQDGLDKALRGLTTADEVVQLVTIESQDAAGPSGLRMSA